MTTIFALSSGSPPAAIAVMRISGPQAGAAVEALAGTLPRPRHATLGRLADPESGTMLDRALLLWFPGPASATGEDLAELHLHGGRAVVRAVEAALERLPGLRPAEPGEFTRRGLASGRIDLTQAEGLGDLLSAETETARRAAVSASEGGLRRRIEGWNDRLLDLSARVEAVLDHGEEDIGVEQPMLEAVAEEARGFAAELATILDNPPVERLRDGIRVVLAGSPNSGKSTLLNALADHDAAIVSPIAGTTRDRIDVAVQRSGIAYVLTDTAGLADDTDDPVERIGIDRARVASREADIVVWLGDALPQDSRGDTIAIFPRSDIPGRASVPAGRIAVSAVTGVGMADLWQSIEEAAADLTPKLDRPVLNRRQRDLVETVLRAVRGCAEERDPLLMAERLRMGLRACDRLTGRADVEAMLDTLFARFCIGK